MPDVYARSGNAQTRHGGAWQHSVSTGEVCVKILVVEDDPQMGALLQRGLGAEGYDVQLVGNGVDALIAVAAGDVCLAAIDVMLPQMSGFEVCRRIREAGNTMPTILLTARDAVEDRVYGLDSGADDYLTKPFAFQELSARIRALLRRDSTGERLAVTVGELRLEALTQTAFLADRRIALSPKEFALLRLLATHGGETLSRVRILEEIWGTAQNIDHNIVDQYVSYLRRKLGATSSVRIVTVRGKGYALDAG